MAGASETLVLELEAPVVCSTLYSTVISLLVTTLCSLTLVEGPVHPSMVICYEWQQNFRNNNIIQNENMIDIFRRKQSKAGGTQD